MADYFPKYKRGESIIGYSARCMASRDLIKSVDSPQVRLEMCKEYALDMREAIRQPFSVSPKKSS